MQMASFNYIILLLYVDDILIANTDLDENKN